ncbi:hypothetical protein [Arenibacter certesii]|uniref:Uncharacterized protein n=1 Tax=Arenibacter certesii TaxID=228955 RepID=A0A918IY88_9FLAO|nr:hypothetical protein [Arenibacter certesii]GGW37926.1 hypothetical protein GCM10007383_23420 [Arenibacter certesii]
MKKCILFFIGLIFILLVSIITDDSRSRGEEDNFVNKKVEGDKNFAENRAAPDLKVWKR